MYMLTTHDTADTAFSLLGENADKKWFLTLNFPVGMMIGYDRWDNKTRIEQKKYLTKYFIKYFSCMFPKAVIVFEETKRGNIHMHACCTGTFQSYGDFKDWFIDLYRLSSHIRKHGRYDIGMLCKNVYKEDGLKEYLSKSPFQDKYYSFVQINTKKFKKHVPKLFKKKINISSLDI